MAHGGSHRSKKPTSVCHSIGSPIVPGGGCNRRVTSAKRTRRGPPPMPTVISVAGSGNTPMARGIHGPPKMDSDPESTRAATLTRSTDPTTVTSRTGRRMVSVPGGYARVTGSSTYGKSQGSDGLLATRQLAEPHEHRFTFAWRSDDRRAFYSALLQSDEQRVRIFGDFNELPVANRSPLAWDLSEKVSDMNRLQPLRHAVPPSPQTF
jgi:hypothetical protein